MEIRLPMRLATGSASCGVRSAASGERGEEGARAGIQVIRCGLPGAAAQLVNGGRAENVFRVGTHGRLGKPAVDEGDVGFGMEEEAPGSPPGSESLAGDVR